MAEIEKTNSNDLKSQIEETMRILGIREFDELDPILKKLNRETFPSFMKEKTHKLLGYEKARAVNFIAARKSYLDYIKENNGKA